MAKTITWSITEDFGQMYGVLTDIVSEVYDAPIVPDVIDEIRHVMRQNFEEIFDRQEDEFGTAWPPHSPATVAMMGPHPLLIWTEALIGSVTGRNSFGFDEYGDDHYVLTTTVPYAAYHQHGTSRMPARPFFYLSEPTRERIQGIVIDAIKERFKRVMA